MPDKKREPNHLTVDEAAAMLGVSMATVYKMVREGKLRGQRVQKKIVIYRDSVEAWIREHQFGAQTKATKEKRPKRKRRQNSDP